MIHKIGWDAQNAGFPSRLREVESQQSVGNQKQKKSVDIFAWRNTIKTSNRKGLSTFSNANCGKVTTKEENGLNALRKLTRRESKKINKKSWANLETKFGEISTLSSLYRSDEHPVWMRFIVYDEEFVTGLTAGRHSNTFVWGDNSWVPLIKYYQRMASLT